MWTIGHLSLGYILSRPGFGKKPLRPITLLSIFLIAFIPDVAHLYFLRTISHSLIFFIPFIMIILWIIFKLGIIQRNEIIPLVVVALAHIIGDLLFGSFELFYPFDLKGFGVLAWGSYLDMSVEVIFFTLMMVGLWITGDLRNLKENVKFKPKETKWQSIFQDGFLIMLILAILGQIGAIIYLDFYKGPNFYNQMVYHDGSMPYISFIFMLVYVVFLILLINWILKRWIKSKTTAKEYK